MNGYAFNFTTVNLCFSFYFFRSLLWSLKFKNKRQIFNKTIYFDTKRNNNIYMYKKILCNLGTSYKLAEQIGVSSLNKCKI